MTLEVPLRLAHANPREPGDDREAMGKCLDGTQTAGELYGRVLVVIAAEESAGRVVPPVSNRRPRGQWSSGKDTAEGAPGTRPPR